MIGFSQYLIETNLELVKTDLKSAIKYAHKKFSQFGNKLYDFIPDFDAHYEYAQTHASGGHTQRKDMPVIHRADIIKFKKEIDDHGIKTKYMKVEVGSLHPIQQQIYLSKSIDAIAQFGIKKSLQFLKDKKTVTVMSKDRYIIDGHHRFLTGMLIDPKMKVNVLMIDMPISELLPYTLDYSDKVGNVRNESIYYSLNEVRIASRKTLNNSKKTRTTYAYHALERDSLNDIEGADEAFERYLHRKMNKEEQLRWALKELEYRELHNENF